MTNPKDSASPDDAPPDARRPEPFTIGLEDDLVLLQFHDPLDAELFLAGVRAANEHCVTRKFKRLLIDTRPAPGGLSFIDRYTVASEGARIIGPHVRVAVIQRLDQAHPDKFGKTVAANRGAQVELFSDEAPARDWLNAPR